VTDKTYPESEIEALRKQIQKRQTLFLILSMLDQLPAVKPSPLGGGVTPGAVTAGAFHMEHNHA
jgi:hypothetical protein